MKKYILSSILILLCASGGYAQNNVKVRNTTSEAIPVKVTEGITLGDVTLNGGDASQAKQDTGNTSLASIDTKTSAQATAAKQDTAAGKLDTIITNTGAGATAAKQDTAATKLDTINTTLGSQATAANQATTNTKLDTLTAAVATAAKQDSIITAIGALPTSTRVNSTAYVASAVLKASAGTLISFSGYNSGPSQFVQIFDSATVPANGTVPAKILWVPSGTNFSTDVPITGVPFSTGISFSNSSTAVTKTIGSSDIFFTAVIR